VQGGSFGGIEFSGVVVVVVVIGGLIVNILLSDGSSFAGWLTEPAPIRLGGTGFLNLAGNSPVGRFRLEGKTGVHKKLWNGSLHMSIP
jgi:hypothetical protein